MPDLYARLDTELPDAPTRLLVLPHFEPPPWPERLPEASGVIAGLKSTTTRGEILTAIMEGATFHFVDGVAALRRLGIDTTECVASGGGARSGAWLQIKADILGVPFALRRGDKPKRAAFAHRHRGRSNRVVDDRRETPRETDDLQQTEGAGDIHDAPKRIVSIGLAKFGTVARAAKILHDRPERRKTGVHTQIDIVGLSHIAVGGQRGGTDDDRVDAMPIQGADNRLGGKQQGFRILHGTLLRFSGIKHAKSSANVSAVLIRSSIERHPRRSSSAASERAALTLRRGGGTDLDECVPTFV